MSLYVRVLAGLGLVSDSHLTDGQQREVATVPTPKEQPPAGYDWAGEYPVTPGQDPLHAMSALARFPWVYAAVAARSKDAGSVPLKLVRGKGKRSEEIESHPVLDLIQQPMSAESGSQVSGILLSEQLVADVVLSGNAYVMPAGRPKPVSVMRLHPERVRAIPTTYGTVGAWEYGPERTRYAVGDVIQMRGISWEDGPQSLYGQGIIRALGDQLSAELSALTREKSSQSMGRPAVIVTPKARAEDMVTTWTPQQMADVERRMNAALTRQTGKAVALPGELELIAAGWSPAEMESEALHTRVRDAVLAAAGVPPTRLSLVTANFATAQAEMASYWRSTVLSDVRMLCEMWTTIARRWDPEFSVVADTSAIHALQYDRTERVSRAQTHIIMGMDPAAAYAYEGLDDAPWTSAPTPAAPAVTSGTVPQVAGASVDQPAADQASVDVALNGAQVKSALEIITQVAAKLLPRDTGIAALVAFLGISEETAEKVMASVGTTFFVEPPVDGGPIALPRAAAVAAAHRIRAAVIGERRPSGESERAARWSKLEAVRSRSEMELARKLSAHLRKVAQQVGAELVKRYPQRSFTRADEALIDSILDKLIGAGLGELYGTWAGPARERAWREAARVVAPDRLTYDPDAPGVSEWTASRIVRVTEDTKAMAREAIAAGLDNGETVNEIQARLQRTEAFAPSRALRIARTESAAVMTDGQDKALAEAKELGVDVRKEWLSSRDGSVRPSHRRMDGQVVDVGANFTSPSGATGPGPGEMSTAAESVNCRCTVIPVVE